MKISWEWLNSFISLKNSSPQEVSEQLTLAGCEIEEVEEITVLDKKDYILNITSTPNRSDLQGMVGIAKEICAILDLDQGSILNMEKELILTEKNLQMVNYQDNSSSSLSISNTHCYISGLSDQAIPKFIKTCLESSGIEVQNNINDIGNYSMLKWGHPVEIINILSNSNLKADDISFVIESKKNDHYKGKETQITDIVVTKHKNVRVALTAIETDKNYRANKISNQICLQVMVIPINIVRKNSKYSNIRNESSIRYERGLNQTSLKFALLDTILLIKKIYPEALVGDIYNNINKRSNLEFATIRLHLDKIRSVLGKIEVDNTIQDIDAKKVQKILLSLGCSVIDYNSFFEVTIPDARKHDLSREIDLIEEIARIQGLNKFNAILPKFKNLQIASSRNRTIKELARKMRSLGMTEVVHYSLASQTYHEKVELENPLMSEYNSLRTNLISNLIESFNNNIKKGNHNFDAFEIGRVFTKNSDFSHESEVVGGIFGGRLRRISWESPLRNMNWFEAKGILELLLSGLIEETIWKNEIQQQHSRLLHPKKSSSIFLKDKYLGCFGEVHPQIVKEKNLPNSIFCFELNLIILIKNLQEKPNYTHEFQQYSSFPSIIRDIAIVIPIDVNIESVVQIIKNQDYSILKNVQLFDEYKGKNIEKQKRSIAFRLTYQSGLKTLTAEEVDKINEELKTKIKEQLNTKFR